MSKEFVFDVDGKDLKMEEGNLKLVTGHNPASPIARIRAGGGDED